MKKKNEIQKPNLVKCKIQLSELTSAMHRVDQHSQDALDLSELSPKRRLELNDAYRTLKRTIILAQTDLWNALVLDDNIARIAAINEALEVNKKDGEYEITAQWKPAKKPKPKKKKR